MTSRLLAISAVFVPAVAAAAASISCGGPDFAVATSANDASDIADVPPDLPPIVCKHCDNAPPDAGADVDGDGEDGTQGDSARDGKEDTEDATVHDATGVEAGGEADTAPSADSSTEAGCAPGWSVCSAECLDLSANLRNCGACGNDCTQLPNVNAAGLACIGGSCSYRCAPGYGDCDDAGGCATSLQVASHCGACNTACGGGLPVCAPADGGGAYGCGTGCSSGQSNCSGTCADLTTDSAHCGACGVACLPGTHCSGGHCACDTTSGCPGCCSGGTTCVPYSSQTGTNCGNDGNTCGGCTGGQTCNTSNGQCACTGGETVCTGTCVNTATDSNNCGACGHSCLAGACTMGQCQPFVLAPNIVGAGWALADGTAYYESTGAEIIAYDAASGSLIGSDAFGQASTVFAQDATNLFIAVSGTSNTEICVASKSLVQNIGGCLYVLSTNDPLLTSIVEVGASLWWLDLNHVLWSGTAAGAPATMLDTAAGFLLAGDAAGLVWFEMNNSLVSASTGFASGQTPTALSIPTGAVPGYPNNFVLTQLLIVDGANAYWYNQTDGGIYRSPRNGSAYVRLAVTSHAPPNLAVDSNYVYWTDPPAGTVSRAPIAGGAAVSIATAQASPYGIAVDTNAVYWTNGNSSQVPLMKLAK